jgi:hypothetical protein
MERHDALAFEVLHKRDLVGGERFAVDAILSTPAEFALPRGLEPLVDGAQDGDIHVRRPWDKGVKRKERALVVGADGSGEAAREEFGNEPKHRAHAVFAVTQGARRHVGLAPEGNGSQGAREPLSPSGCGQRPRCIGCEVPP